MSACAWGIGSRVIGNRLPRMPALAIIALICWSVVAAPAAIAQRLTDEQAQTVDDFILGNTLFTLYHEFGHALISEYNLPVLGSEEDAVDRLAAVFMAPDPNMADDEYADALTLLGHAADGWQMTWELTQQDPGSVDFWGEHSLDIRRFTAVVCLLYGSDPDGLADLPAEVGMPPERAETCPAEFELSAESWFSLLDPYYTDAENQPVGGDVFVVFDKARDRDAREMEQWLRETELLDYVADDIALSFDLPRDLVLRAASCGEPNAFWTPADGEVTLCYELLIFFRDLGTILALDE